VSDVLRLRSEGLQWLDADGEVVALDESSLLYLGANGSGSLLWQELAAGTSRDALVARLVETYEIDEGVAGADVDAFVADLERRGLLA
jgi:coenzyme PQQ synthesis protein D (PqqD)